MSIALRIILIVCAFLTFIYILRRVKKCDMNVSDTVFWIAFSAILIVIAVFPQIAYFVSDALGFMSPINFVLISIIAILVFKIFSMSTEISRLRSRLSSLAQTIGIDRIR